MAADLGIRRDSSRFLPRDRDDTYGAAFDAVFEAEGLDVILSAPRAPRMNAHCERVIGSIRREALDHVLITGEAHARWVLTGYQDHYNRHRPHRARQQLPPDADRRPPPSTTSTTEDSSVPESSAASSTSTDTLPDVQRWLSEPYTMPWEAPVTSAAERSPSGEVRCDGPGGHEGFP
ncbi:integrase core domain-containing protein, partial [Streptomyces viridosporus]|uniref:integrase core domain-containing protein n=1 Tax=Streptomyces viridosporus TaxID=67581 RepID=UPI003D9F25D2